MKYRTIDLFAGIGGIRRGFELTGRFKNVLSAEIDKYACLTYQYLFGENPKNDVSSDTFKKKVINTPYDVLLAGFPCQPFSFAGKKEGFKDKTRGTFFYDIIHILERSRPKAFFLENVSGLIKHDNGRTFKIIIESLHKDLNYKIIGVEENSVTGELEYDPKFFILNSKNFGVPQNRPRVYIIGFDRKRYGEACELINPGIFPRKRSGPPIYKNLNEVLELCADEEYYLSQGLLDTLKKHKNRHRKKGNGFGYFVVNDPKIENPISNPLLATGGSGKEKNLVYDPQEKIVGKKVENKKTPLNREGIRYMTPREWAKLQGFIGYGFMKDGVDHFAFPPGISKTQQYKQLGNSVTIPVVEELAKMMANVMDKLENDNSQLNDNFIEKAL